MKRIIQLPLAEAKAAIRSYSHIPPFSARPIIHRTLHTTPPKPATAHDISLVGPPPSAPVPDTSDVDIRVARRRKQAELLKHGQDLRDISSGKGSGTAKTKRFWKDVHVRQAEGLYYPIPYLKPE